MARSAPKKVPEGKKSQEFVIDPKTRNELFSKNFYKKWMSEAEKKEIESIADILFGNDEIKQNIGMIDFAHSNNTWYVAFEKVELVEYCEKSLKLDKIRIVPCEDLRKLTAIPFEEDELEESKTSCTIPPKKRLESSPNDDTGNKKMKTAEHNVIIIKAKSSISSIKDSQFYKELNEDEKSDVKKIIPTLTSYPNEDKGLIMILKMTPNKGNFSLVLEATKKEIYDKLIQVKFKKLELRYVPTLFEQVTLLINHDIIDKTSVI